MLRGWFKRHWHRVGWVVVVTGAMLLAYRSLIPVWIFYTLLSAMHVWIFYGIGSRVYRNWKDRER